MTAAPTGPTREAELHAHYAANAIATGHAADCAMVTTDVNWPTLSGRPSCTCPVGGNTPEAQIAARNGKPKAQPGEDLVRELNAIRVTDRLLFLNWLARHRTSQLRSALREFRAARPLSSGPVVPPMTVPGKPDTRYPPPGE